MNIKRLVASLHPLERAVLPVLDKANSLNQIVVETKLKEVQVMRALQWLQNKKILTIKEETVKVVDLDTNGKKYFKEGLPEKRLLEALKKSPLTIKMLFLSMI